MAHEYRSSFCVMRDGVAHTFSWASAGRRGESISFRNSLETNVAYSAFIRFSSVSRFMSWHCCEYVGKGSFLFCDRYAKALWMNRFWAHFMRSTQTDWCGVQTMDANSGWERTREQYRDLRQRGSVLDNLQDESQLSICFINYSASMFVEAHIAIQ